MRIMYLILLGVCLMTTSCSKDELPEPSKKEIGPLKWPKENRPLVDTVIHVKRCY